MRATRVIAQASLVVMCVIVLACGGLLVVTNEFLAGGAVAAVGVLLGYAATTMDRPKRPVLALALLGLAALIVWLGPSVVKIFASARVAQGRASCLTNIKSLGTAIGLYVSDSNDHFPPAKRWLTVSKPYGAKELHCPWERTPFSYAMNEALSAWDADQVGEPNTTVMVFEMDAEVADAHGGPGDLCVRHGVDVICAVDGHARFNFRERRWKP